MPRSLEDEDSSKKTVQPTSSETRSTSGTGRSEQTRLALTTNAKSVCAILKQAHESGVSYLKLGDLEVRFKDQPGQARSQQDEFEEFAEANAKDSAAEVSGKASKVPKDVLDQFAEEQALLDDPLAYESRLIDRHFSGHAGTDEEA